MTKPESGDDLENATQSVKRGSGRPKGSVTKKPKAAQPGTPGGLVPDDHPKD